MSHYLEKVIAQVLTKKSLYELIHKGIYLIKKDKFLFNR